MASRQVTLAKNAPKKDAVIATAGSASSNVIVQFDDTMDVLQVVTSLEKIKQVIQEQEY